MTTHALSPTATLHHADCRDALRLLPDNSVDSVVTDPPYALTAMTRPRPNLPSSNHFARRQATSGFMGKTWDTGEVAFDAAFWAEVLRVLKPGGHVAAFGASRGYHRMAVAIEDAGFEIRDSLMWLYGTGFPKSQNVSKFIDKELGTERDVLSERAAYTIGGNGCLGGHAEGATAKTLGPPVTPAAIEFDGFGTALKPAFEPIVLARKPLSESTVAANVLRWRTGALNIGACRVGIESTVRSTGKGKRGRTDGYGMEGGVIGGSDAGRWPANVVHDGSDEVVGAFPQSNGQLADANNDPARQKTSNVYGAMRAGNGRDGEASADKRYTENGGTNFAMKPGARRGDSGSAARFFKACPYTESDLRFMYSAKASKADRNGSKHPTVKPISLMEWLATLITPPGGTILDPFAGSGTTGKAAQNKGFSVILCEREAEYVTDICARFAPAVAPCPVPAPIVAPCPVS